MTRPRPKLPASKPAPAADRPGALRASDASVGQMARTAALAQLPAYTAAIVEAAADMLAARVSYLSHDGALEVLSAIGAALSRHHLRTKS